MPLKKEGKIIGYHGTDSKHVDSILTKGFKASRRNDHWLGQGIYFYTSLELAKWWIKRKKKGTSNNAVIEVLLDCGKCNVLDLDTINGLDFFLEEAHNLLHKNSNIGNYQFNNDEEYKNLCFILDLLKAKFDIEIIICTFLKDSATYTQGNVKTFEKNHFFVPLGLQYKETQICIRSNNCILEKECIHNNISKSLPKKWK